MEDEKPDENDILTVKEYDPICVASMRMAEPLAKLLQQDNTSTTNLSFYNSSCMFMAPHFLADFSRGIFASISIDAGEVLNEELISDVVRFNK